MTPQDPATTALFPGTVDLASSDVGGQALLASDAFFAGPERLVLAG